MELSGDDDTRPLAPQPSEEPSETPPEGAEPLTRGGGEGCEQLICGGVPSNEARERVAHEETSSPRCGRARWAAVGAAVLLAAAAACHLATLPGRRSLRHGLDTPLEEKALWCDQLGPPPARVWQPARTGRPAQVKVLSYNLFWWNLFDIRGGGDSFKLLAETDHPAYDLMGFQECEDLNYVMKNAGLASDYELYKGNHATCMAFKKSRFEMLTVGEAEIAEDAPGQYFGKRQAQWLRLRHLQSGNIVLFMNHHGPTPVNSGGACGGDSVARNLIRLIEQYGQPGDAVILVGDFNAIPNSRTIQGVSSQLLRVFSGVADGGIDHIFTNLLGQAVLQTANLGSGGSDHDAISATFQIGDWPLQPRPPPPPVFRQPPPAPAPPHSGPVLAGSPLPLGAPAPADKSLFEWGVRYVVFNSEGVWGRQEDHVSTPQECGEHCVWHHACRAWTWVQNAHLPNGNPSQCWLHGLPPAAKVSQAGFVSGLPPAEEPRDALPSTTPLAPLPAPAPAPTAAPEPATSAAPAPTAAPERTEPTELAEPAGPAEPAPAAAATKGAATRPVGDTQQCAVMEDGIDYVSPGGWEQSADHIPAPAMCCALCDAEPRCASWTWVADAGLDGVPSQCWLKGSNPTGKIERSGFVSGLPQRSVQRDKAVVTMSPVEPGSCGSVEPGVDYVVPGEGWAKDVDHILSDELCCSLCQQESECVAWTWVWDAPLATGAGSQCRLRGGLPRLKLTKDGFVSGLRAA